MPYSFVHDVSHLCDTHGLCVWILAQSHWWETTFNHSKENPVRTFNAKKLIADCGGVRRVALILGKTRTAPYRMMASGLMNTRQFEKLLSHNPELNLNHYFEEPNDIANEARPEANAA